MPTNETYQQGLVRRLERTLLAFFLLAIFFLLLVYVVDPSIYTATLMLQQPSPSDRYPLAATLFLVGILVFVTILMVGIVRHWRWLFWLLLVAFGFSILIIPATLLEFTGVLPRPFPVWYSLARMGVALLEGVIAVWMVHIYRHHGVWAMGKKQTR